MPVRGGRARAARGGDKHVAGGRARRRGGATAGPAPRRSAPHPPASLCTPLRARATHAGPRARACRARSHGPRGPVAADAPVRAVRARAPRPRGRARGAARRAAARARGRRGLQRRRRRCAVRGLQQPVVLVPRVAREARRGRAWRGAGAAVPAPPASRSIARGCRLCPPPRPVPPCRTRRAPPTRASRRCRALPRTRRPWTGCRTPSSTPGPWSCPPLATGAAAALRPRQRGPTPTCCTPWRRRHPRGRSRARTRMGPPARRGRPRRTAAPRSATRRTACAARKVRARTCAGACAAYGHAPAAAGTRRH